MKKLYKSIDSVPLGKWNMIILAIKHDKKELADKLFNETLALIKDIKSFEVFMLKRKLLTEAAN